jgi:hypothetical protein
VLSLIETHGRWLGGARAAEAAERRTGHNNDFNGVNGMLSDAYTIPFHIMSRPPLSSSTVPEVCLMQHWRQPGKHNQAKMLAVGNTKAMSQQKNFDV